MVPFIFVLFFVGITFNHGIPSITTATNIENNQNLSRIVGGTIYNISMVPYQVSIQSLGFHTCGGSILTSKFILTAAHCIVGHEEDWPYYQIRVGSNFPYKQGQVLKIKNFFPHPNYNTKPSWTNDMAILELKSDITFNENAQAVILPNFETEVPIGKFGIASGWGKTSENGPAASQLLGVTIPINDPETCEISYPGKFNRSTMICAGSIKGGQSTCQGDSGGPLVVDGIQYGVVSWALGCARPYHPTVFSHVANLRQFISDIVGI